MSLEDARRAEEDRRQEKHALLDATPQRAVLRLIRDGLRPSARASEVDGSGDLIGIPLADAPVQDLSGTHEVVHGPDGFFERCLRVVAMALIEVDVVDA